MLINVVCENCGKEFFRKPSEIKRSNHHFCSNSCSAKYSNPISPTTKITSKCTKCGLEKEDSEFSWKNKSLGIKHSQCKSCFNKQRREYYLNNKPAEYKRSQIGKLKMRNVFKAYKSTLSCVICGESEYCCLDFHHLNSEDKDYLVSKLVVNGASALLREEIKKCVALCANCHRKVHAGIIKW